MNTLREYIRSLITEKELRDQKDKRVMYHIGKRPASPKPAERWGEKGGWTRYWVDGPVPSGVFMTPNPTDVVQYHGVSGNVYAYKVPEWVIARAGGKQRFDSAGELLISQELWDEAGDEIEFLGKTMDQNDLWDSVDSSYYSARQRKGKRAKHNQPAKFTIAGLRMTSDPEAVIKMMKPHERKRVWAELEDMYPVAMKGEEFEVEWEHWPGERKGWRKDFLLGEPRMSKSNRAIMDLLKKHITMAEGPKVKITRSQLRRIIRESLLSEDDAGFRRPTVGAVLDAIQVVQDIEDEDVKREELKKLEKQLGWKVLKMLSGPLGDAVGAAKDIASIYKTVKGARRHHPEKMDNPVMDLLQIDGGYKEMLDDAVEFEFDKDMVAYLGSLKRTDPLPDMTKKLEKWVNDKFNRKISGAGVSEK